MSNRGTRHPESSELALFDERPMRASRQELSTQSSEIPPPPPPRPAASASPSARVPTTTSASPSWTRCSCVPARVHAGEPSASRTCRRVRGCYEQGLHRQAQGQGAIPRILHELSVLLRLRDVHATQSHPGRKQPQAARSRRAASSRSRWGWGLTICRCM